MKRLLTALLLLAFCGIAAAQTQPPFAQLANPCLGSLQYGTMPFCFDTGSGGMYWWNGSWMPGGVDFWHSNAGAGQTTATSTYFSALGNTTNNTTEAVTMELPVSFPEVVKVLSCYTSAAPGTGASDTFTIRSSTSLGGTMADSTVTCAISGATAKSCTDNAHTLSLAAGSVIDIKDTTASTPSARTIGCVVEME